MINNKGFAISTMLYAMLLMATLIMFLLIGNFSFERNSTDDFVDNIKNELNGNDEIIDSSNISVVGADGSISGNLIDISLENVTLADKIKIVSIINENYVINIENNKVSTNGANINLNIADNLEGQEFSLIESNRDGYYYIVQASSKTFGFDITGSSSASNTNIQLNTLNNGTNQQFKFVDTGEKGIYYIESGLGTCVDAYGGKATNSTNIDSHSCNQSAAQKWKVMVI